MDGPVDVLAPGDVVAEDSGFVRYVSLPRVCCELVLGGSRCHACMMDAAVTLRTLTCSGHGISVRGSLLVSTLAGTRTHTAAHVRVSAPDSVYAPAAGDTVIAIVESVVAGEGKWRLDVRAAGMGVLSLAGVAVPGGDQRRRTVTDTHAMRAIAAEGDVIAAEVHSVGADGAAVLHARSHTHKHGVLQHGVHVDLRPGCVERLPSHFLTLRLPTGSHARTHTRTHTRADAEGRDADAADAGTVTIHVIIGMNARVWVGALVPVDGGASRAGDEARLVDAVGEAVGEPVKADADGGAAEAGRSESGSRLGVPRAARLAAARVVTILRALSRANLPVRESSITAAYMHAHTHAQTHDMLAEGPVPAWLAAVTSTSTARGRAV